MLSLINVYMILPLSVIGNIYKGILINGSCQTCSQNDPNLMITIKDELYLSKQTLWVNDRVYSPDGKLLIGNIDDIPYKFDKKSSTWIS